MLYYNSMDIVRALDSIVSKPINLFLDSHPICLNNIAGGRVLFFDSAVADKSWLQDEELKLYGENTCTGHLY